MHSGRNLQVTHGFWRGAGHLGYPNDFGGVVEQDGPHVGYDPFIIEIISGCDLGCLKVVSHDALTFILTVD
jgi:hypothetical protein